MADQSNSVVWAYAIASDGSYTSVGSGSTGSNLFGVALDPLHRYVYACTPDANVWSFVIQPDGSLSANGDLTLQGSNPVYLAVDPSGSYVYVSDNNGGGYGVGQYVIQAGGSLAANSPASVFGGTNNLASIIVDPIGQYVYVMSAQGTIFVFQITGGLLPSSPTNTYPSGLGTGGNAMSTLIDPTNSYFYVTGASASANVAMFTISGGVLTGPTNYGTGAGPSGIAMDPTGTYVYIANSADSTISQYTLGPGGALLPLATPIVGNPDGSPNYLATAAGTTQSFLFAANSNGIVSEYTIGPGGQLSQINSIPTGSGLLQNIVAW